MSYKSDLASLKAHLRDIFDLQQVGNLLNWDQSTYMPPGGVAARARQAALIDTLAHTKLTDKKLGKLLDRLQPRAESLPYDSDDASLIRVTRWQFERATKVPGALVAEMGEHQARSYQLWAEARPANDFSRVVATLEKTLDFSRRVSECYAPYEHIADPLIDGTDLGMRASSIKEIFGQLRAALVPLVQQISAQPLADDRCVKQHFPEADQWAFGEHIIRQFGYDYSRGRQDKTLHPFMTKILAGRCAHHHPFQRERHRRRPVQHPTRIGPRHV